MGDVSVLSHEYKAASELSHTINQAVIALKKTCWGLPGAEAITPEQVDTHRHCLAALLEAFAALLAPTGAHRLDGVGTWRTMSMISDRWRLAYAKGRRGCPLATSTSSTSWPQQPTPRHRASSAG
jgi:hypothetical protein